MTSARFSSANSSDTGTQALSLTSSSFSGLLGKWGALQLTTTGRRSGRLRSVIIGYYEDGPNLVSMAMNGWGAAEPAWWLNLQADPNAAVDLAGGERREVVGRAAFGEERERLWQRWRELDKNLDSYSARRPRETAVVILEPIPSP